MWKKNVRTCIIWVFPWQEPVEDVVVTLYARQLVGNTGFLKQICNIICLLFKYIKNDCMDFILLQNDSKSIKESQILLVASAEWVCEFSFVMVYNCESFLDSVTWEYLWGFQCKTAHTSFCELNLYASLFVSLSTAFPPVFLWVCVLVYL